MTRVWPSRPHAPLPSETRVTDTPDGRAYVTVSFHEGRPVEVFVTLGRTGSTERAYAEALGRLCSVALQRGVPLGVLTQQLRGVSSEASFGLGPNKILSVPDAVGRLLQELEEDHDG